MTTGKEATDKDFEQMMQMLRGFWVDVRVADIILSLKRARDHQ